MKVIIAIFFCSFLSITYSQIDTTGYKLLLKTKLNAFYIKKGNTKFPSSETKIIWCMSDSEYCKEDILYENKVFLTNKALAQDYLKNDLENLDLNNIPQKFYLKGLLLPLPIAYKNRNRLLYENEIEEIWKKSWQIEKLKLIYQNPNVERLIFYPNYSLSYHSPHHSSSILLQYFGSARHALRNLITTSKNEKFGYKNTDLYFSNIFMEDLNNLENPDTDSYEFLINNRIDVEVVFKQKYNPQLPED